MLHIQLHSQQDGADPVLLLIWLLLLLLRWRKSISFDKARTAAEKLRSRVVLGESPIEGRKQLRLIPTLAELYRDTYLPHLQNTRWNMGSDLSFWKVHI